jgi:hypothetical protein
MVNENKAMQQDLSRNEKTYGEKTQMQKFLEEKNERVEKELSELKLAYLKS